MIIINDDDFVVIPRNVTHCSTNMLPGEKINMLMISMMMMIMVKMQGWLFCTDLTVVADKIFEKFL